MLKQDLPYVSPRVKEYSNLGAVTVARDVKFRMYKQFNAWQAAEKARLPAGSSAAATAGSAHTGDESVETDATEEGATASATDEAISVAPASTEAHSHAEAA